MVPTIDLPNVEQRKRQWPLFHYQRNVYLLLLYTLGKGFQLSIGALAINLYIYSLGYHADFIGIVTGVPAIGALISSIPVGILADRIGRKPLLLISAALTPLTLVGVAIGTDGPFLITASILNGILASAYWITNLPMLTESTSEQERVGVLAMNSFLLLGVGALGSLIGGIVPELVGGLLHVAANSVVPLRWGVLISAIIAALPGIGLFWLREPSRHGQQHMQETANGRAGIDPNRWQLVALFTMLLLPDVLFVLGQSMVISLLQLYFALRFRLNPGNLGVIFTVMGVIGGAMALLAPRLVQRWDKLRIAAVLQCISVPLVIGIGLAPTPILAATAEFGRNIVRGLFEPVYASFTMGSVSSRWRATLSGFYGITWSLGFGVGATLAGFLQQHIGLSAPFFVGAGCIVIAPILLFVFFGRVRT